VGNWLENLLAQATDHPAAPAIQEGERRLTYGQFLASVERLHMALDRHGIAAGEPVAILLPSGARFLAAFVAVAARAVAVPLEPTLTTHELAPRLAVTEPSLVIGTPSLLNQAAPALARCSSLRGAIVLGRGELDVFRDQLGDLDCAPPPAERLALQVPADSAEVSCHFTYKGLGYPLGAVHRFSDYTLAIQGLEHAFGAGPGDRHLAVLPLQPVYGLVTAGVGPLTCGGEVVFLPRLNPRRLLADLAKERIRFASLVPPLYRILLAAAKRKGPGDLDPDLVLSTGGSLMSVAQAQALEEALGRPIHQGYGLTETLPATFNALGQAQPGTLGRPVAGMQIEVRDAFGVRTPPGVAGEIYLRSEQIMSGYLHRPRETARFLQEGWFRTGDLGTLDASGVLHFLGRREAFTKVNSQMVDLLEVEQALCTHPAVTRACATTRPNAKGEDELRVAVTLTGQAHVRLGELLRVARERLAPHKVPKRIKVYRAVYEGFEAEF
jgi:long-chain acyl-CoA synthetase